AHADRVGGGAACPMTVVILRIILVSLIARRRSGADGLVGHGDGELRTLILRQDALAPILPCRRSEPLPRERFRCYGRRGEPMAPSSRQQSDGAPYGEAERLEQM